MPLLKLQRGTVLVVELVFLNPNPPYSVEHVVVFNLGIGGVRASEFVIDDDSVIPFGKIVPSLNGIVAERVIVYGTFPDGNHIKTNDIYFSNTIEVIWSEHRILAAHPNIDPDWRKNPTMLIVTPGGTAVWP